MFSSSVDLDIAFFQQIRINVFTTSCRVEETVRPMSAPSDVWKVSS